MNKIIKLVVKIFVTGALTIAPLYGDSQTFVDMQTGKMTTFIVPPNIPSNIQYNINPQGFPELPRL